MKKVLKICFVITKSEVGGAQFWVYNFIKNICYDTKVHLITDKPGWLTKKLASLPVTLKYLKNLPIISVITAHSLYNIFKNEKYDKIILNSAYAGIYGRVSGCFINTPIIYVSHGWSALYVTGKLKPVYISLEKLFSRLCKEIWCVSDEDYNKALNRLQLPPDKLHIVRTKINDTSTADAEFFAEKNLLSVMRMESPKRGDLLIKAVQNTNYHLTIYGDGSHMDTWQALDIGAHVNFAGLNENIHYSKSLGIFILISDSEGLPMSAVEAMRAGMPLVLSDVGGCSELISNNGFLVQNNVESIKIAIDLIYQNYGYYSQKSHELFAEKYSLSSDPNYYLDLLKGTKI